jgi:hypothetical protein
MWYDPNNPIRDEFKTAREMMQAVAKGTGFVCCGVFGPAGIGKTHHARQVFSDLGMVEDRNWMLTRGSGIGLLHNAYHLREGGVLLMDDCDELVIGGGQSHTNRMKELLQRDRVRKISNYTKAAMSGKDDLPEVFKTKVGIIWLTNLDIHKLDAKTRERIAPLESRGMVPVTIDAANNPHNRYNYVISLVADDGVRLTAGKTKAGHDIVLSREESNDVLRFFHMHAWHLDEISFRRLLVVAAYRREFPQSWLKHANKHLLKDACCNDPLPPAYQIPIPQTQEIVSFNEWQKTAA